MAKSKYDKYIAPKLLLVEAWARDGITDVNIAKKLGVAYSTFRLYKSKNIALSAALEKGKEAIDIEVENALYKKCIGYNVKVQKSIKIKTVQYDESTQRKILEKEEIVTAYDEVHVAADTTAQKFWLSCRKPQAWREKAQVEDSAEFGVIEMPKVEEENG